MTYRADDQGVYRSLGKPVDELPDGLDVYSFMFEYFPPSRPDVRGKGIPLLIDEETGLKWTFEDVRERVDLLSLALFSLVEVKWDTRVGLFSPNSMDYGTAIWASHRIGAIVSAANPSFGESELSYQLEESKSKVLFLHEMSREAGFKAAEKAGIKRDHIILIQDPSAQTGKQKIEGAWTLVGLIEEAKKIVKEKSQKALQQCRTPLKPGQAREKLAFISFSSGTTGLPKGVAIQHYAPISNVLQYAAFNECKATFDDENGRFRPGKDVSLGILPMFHIYGLILGLHGQFYMAIADVIIPRFKGIVAMLDTIVRYRISIWQLVPPQVVLFCKDQEARKYHSKCREFTRMVMIGAAPLSDDLSKLFDEALPGIDWGQGYGMTETCTLTLMFPIGEKAVLGSAGRLISNVEARVVTPEGKDCPLDEPGELWIRSPSNALGYTNNAKATQEMWVNGGWVRTGDEAKVNKDGDFFIVDRLKELIKVKGFQVAPAELEGWLLNHASVSDAMVVGIPDDAAGELPLAFVTLTEDGKQKCKCEADVKSLKSDIMRHVSDNKIKYKHLSGVELIDMIPKTASGKILRRTGREMAKKLLEKGASGGSKL